MVVREVSFVRFRAPLSSKDNFLSTFWIIYNLIADLIPVDLTTNRQAVKSHYL
jgi:hypothetical protein